MKTKDRIITMKIRTVKQLDANDFNRYPGIQPTERSLYSDELDLIIAYRVMNETGKHSLLKVALEFSMTPTMRNKCVRGIYKLHINDLPQLRNNYCTDYKDKCACVCDLPHFYSTGNFSLERVYIPFIQNVFNNERNHNVKPKI